jgi:hypothetical protein
MNNLSESKLLENISLIRSKLFIKKFTNELNEINKTSSPESIPQNLKDRINIINLIITQYNAIDAENISDSSKQTTTMFEEVEGCMFNKKWTRLPCMHKAIKLKEYITKHIKNKTARKKIIKILTDTVYDKQLSSGKEVEYDYEKGKIISIPVFKYNEKDKIFTLNNKKYKIT